ncbi:unnamed protein product [Leptidea sinapis]|uniref:Uncharacterized protein n=1 Tax=Leptidea sinapis TaxID=189913 RepID=A0A5E4PWJ5_9NEOP|nr:unnamed protein product [Leptidea sinapis]
MIVRFLSVLLVGAVLVAAHNGEGNDDNEDTHQVRRLSALRKPSNITPIYNRYNFRDKNEEITS